MTTTPPAGAAARDWGAYLFPGRTAAPASAPAPTRRRANTAGRAIFDCIGGCGRKASARRAKDAVCRHCLPALMPQLVPPPPEPEFDLAEIPF